MTKLVPPLISNRARAYAAKLGTKQVKATVPDTVMTEFDSPAPMFACCQAVRKLPHSNVLGSPSGCPARSSGVFSALRKNRTMGPNEKITRAVRIR